MNLTNKLLVAGLMTSAVALQSAEARNPFNGVYVGATAGITSMNEAVDNKTTYDAADPDAAVNFKTKKKTTYQGNLLIGKEVYLFNQDMPLAVEFSFGTTTNAQKKKNAASPGGVDIDQLTKIRQSWKLGLGAVLSHKLTEKMSIAGKLSVVYSKFDVAQKLNDSLFTAPHDGAPEQMKKSFKLWGIEPGVRLSYHVNDCVCTFVEGTYTIFQSKKHTFIDQGAAPNQERFNSKVSPRVWGLVAGVSYKF